MYVFKPTGGFGNTLIHLTTLPDECKLLHNSLYEYELSNCVIIEDFTRVSYDGEQPDTCIIIHPLTAKYIHSKIRNIIKPTPYMEQLIQEKINILEGVTCGMAIRRGSYCQDSRQYNDERGDQPSHFFCSESGLNEFKRVIKQVPGKIFITSDSQSTLKNLIEEFGNKLVTIDTIFTVGAEHDRMGEKHYTDYHNIYLLFFMLSKCPYLYITGGNTDLVGFSTYAYMAAIYGNVPFTAIFND